MKKSYFFLSAILIIILIVSDYLNLPLYLGIEMSNINWNFWIGFLNILTVFGLFVFTYKKIDEKTIKREQNKKALSNMLMTSSYQECLLYIDILTEDTVNNYIVPKTDFNSTNSNTITNNLQQAPFSNEASIMDLAKDGQLEKDKVEGYFKIKKTYSQYILMRITFFDSPSRYEPLEAQLRNMVDSKLIELDK